MNCPRCSEKMVNTNSSGIATASCLYCNGSWVSSKALEFLLEKEPSAPKKSEFQKAFQTRAEAGTKRVCPDCQSQTLYVNHIRGVEIDLCPKCGGVFFDEGEIKKILPTAYKSQYDPGVGEYVAGEGLFWVIVGVLSGGGC